MANGPLCRVLMQEDGDTTTTMGLNFQIAQGNDGREEAPNVK